MKRYGIIYLIRNKVNNKCYIGQTIEKNGFKGRYSRSGKGIERVYRFHKATKENEHLLRSIEKYGLEAFEVDEQFDIAYSKEELDKLEDLYIVAYDCINNGYNNKRGGANGLHSDETKRKLSEVRKQKMANGEIKKSIPPTFHDEKHPGAKTIVCLNDGKIYTTIKSASREYGINSASISSNCKRKLYIGGKDKKGNKLVFRYYEDYIKLSDKDINNIITEVNNLQDTSSRKVICLNTNKIFNSSTEAMKYYNTSKHIYKCCNGITKSCGKLPDGTKLVFRWYDIYLNMTEEEVVKAIEDGQNSKNKENPNIIKAKELCRKKVICLNDNKIFDSLTEASNYYKISKTSISNVCKGKYKHTHNLYFRYYEDYLKQIA